MRQVAGADPGFQVRGAHLKKLRRAEGGAKLFVVFRVKNHDFTPKNHIFSNFRGEPPPLESPLGRWYSPGTPVSSLNKTDLHDIAEMLLKVALNTIEPNQIINRKTDSDSQINFFFATSSVIHYGPQSVFVYCNLTTPVRKHPLPTNS